MNKEANNLYDLHPLIRQRWSPRAFDPRPVEKEKLQSLFEAARWSASAGNQQPWRFILGIRGDSTYSGILETLVEGNRKWNGQAPVLVLSVGRKTLTGSDKPNTHFSYDVGQSLASLSIQATALGLHVHQMAGFSAEKAATIFTIPEPYVPLTVFTLGYLGDPETLDEFNRQRELAPRERMLFSEFVFSGKFDQPSPLFL